MRMTDDGDGKQACARCVVFAGVRELVGSEKRWLAVGDERCVRSLAKILGKRQKISEEDDRCSLLDGR